MVDVLSQPNSGMGSKAVVGIIYPPPEIRAIIDKTSNFVSRNGIEFETRIRLNEQHNPKFDFLNATSPYNAYYQHKVKEFREGKSSGLALPERPEKSAESEASGTAAPEKDGTVRSGTQQQLLNELMIPKEAPASFEFLADPPSISALEIDTVRLAAQFVARNGKQFLTNLQQREVRNYQFDFLRPQHGSMFPFFQKLVEQYTRVLIPPRDVLAKLDSRMSIREVLSEVRYRAAWQRHVEAARQRDADVAERERLAYAAVDWHDFVVVETIDYQPNELGDFPPPTSQTQVGARLIQEERQAQMNLGIKPGDRQGDYQLTEEEAELIAEAEAEEEEEQAALAAARAASAPQAPSQPVVQPEPAAQVVAAATSVTVPSDIIIRKDYDPKRAKEAAARAAAEDWLISPLTGERVPASRFAEHMQINLKDPKWLEERERIRREKEDELFAPGMLVTANLKHLAERRTDIFGVGRDETAIGKKLGEERPRKDKERDDSAWEPPAPPVSLADIVRSESYAQQQQQQHMQSAASNRQSTSTSHSHSHGSVPRGVLPTPIVPAPPLLSMQVPVPPLTSLQLAPSVPVPLMNVSVAVPVYPTSLDSLSGLMPLSYGASSQPLPLLAQPDVTQIAPLGVPPLASFGASGTLESAGLDEPSSKRLRTEETLVDEAEWLRSQGDSPLELLVVCPAMSLGAAETGGATWKLIGQTVRVSMRLSQSVADLKTLIQADTSVPLSKQKLQFENMFLKDAKSLAFYNMLNGSVMQLLIKERGGRKK